MKIKTIKLINGMEVLLIPMKETRLATIMILVGVGSKYEDKNSSGISHFLEHMFLKGTKKRKNYKEISVLVESIGGKIDAFTTYDFTGFFIDVFDKNLDKAIEIISDIYQNPLFKNSEIEKERKVIVEEINMYKDDPFHEADDLLSKLIYGEKPAGWGVLGRKESVMKLKRNDLISYMKNHYTNDKTKIVLAGSFNKKRVIEILNKKFRKVRKGKEMKKEEREEKKKKANISIKFRKTDQAHFVLGIPVFNIYDKRRHILAVLTTILGGGMSSRLWISIREKLGASYYIFSDIDLFSNYGYFSISSGVNLKNVFKVLKILKKELKKISSIKVSDSELKRAKEYLKSDTIMKLKGSDDYANFFGIQRMYFDKNFSIEEIFKKIDNVSLEDIKNLAKELFKKDKIYLSIVGPFKEKDKKNFEKILL